MLTLVNGIININGNKSISNIAKSTLDSSDRSCLYRFLSSSPIDTKLIDRNRINYTYSVLNNNISPDAIGFLSIDDTLSKHSTKSRSMDGLGFHYSHTDGKCVLSHCVVTSNFTVGDTSIPINHSMYYKEDYCKTFDEKFRSKQSIARTFIQEFKSPSNCKEIYVSTYSWYTSSPIIDETLKHSYNFIGAIN